jgi:heat shock protein HslJ
MLKFRPPLWTVCALAALSLAACEEEQSASPLGVPVLIKKVAADEAGDAAVSSGTLVLRGGCLALEHADRSTTLLLWPAEARLERQADGALKVLGTEGTGQETVRVGEEIIVGGSELGGGAADTARVGPGRNIAATAAYPAECSGPVWNVYSFAPGSLTGPGGPAAIAGEWKTAEIGHSPGVPGERMVDVTITQDRIKAQSQCVHYQWTYTLSGEKFTATPEATGEASCERKRTAWEDAFEQAVERARTLTTEPDGGIVLEGPGGEVLLRRK